MLHKDKAALRKAVLAKRRAFERTQRQQAESAIQQVLLTFLRTLDNKQVIAGYCPVNGEVNILPALQNIVSDHSLALPVIVDKYTSLQFNAWDGDESSLTLGKYNIPTARGPAVTPTIILVPLVVATLTGQRLGYGGGYYDRTLAEFPNATTVGIAFDLQIMPELPVEPHDQPLQNLITENGMFSM